MVSLRDDSRELVVLGFEDIPRSLNSWWDADFNDCVFYVTTSSYSAVKTETMQSMQTKSDADQDGVDDISDAYPNDPQRAYNKFSPAKDVYGSLAYEDLWPLKGDYDFNDLVVDYNHKLVLNAKNKVVEIVSTFKTRAIGGAFKNGFGYVLDVNPDMVSSVTGTHLTENIITTNANGTESGQNKAVIVVYDNAFAHMSPVSGYTVNAEKGSPQVEPFVAEVTVTFVTPLSASSLGKSPYRAFIISNKRRGHEIHLPGDAPTDLCDTKLFGTGDDNTNKGRKNYFKTKKSHPWAIHTPEQFDYPAEKNDIVKAFVYLKQWAESAGKRYSDWFRKKSKYRNDKMIY
jgi:LruC domain-containing protein